MSNPIVNINVSIQSAPLPATLQKKGALISQGATITTPGTISPLTQPSDLTPILMGAEAIQSISWAGGVVSVTTVAPHGFTVGDTIPMTIAGTTPAGYSGTFVATITSPTTFNYPLLVSPGTNTVPGAYTVEDVGELVAQVTTFFAQGTAQAVSVLEIGAGNANDGVSFLTNWINANPAVFYSYLVPRFWDGVASFLAFLSTFNATAAKTYFFVTSTLATYQLYNSTMKCVVLMIEAPAYGIWPANALTSISWSGGIVSALTTTNHGVQVGQYFTIQGCAPAAYNGTFLALPGTTGNTLVYALAANPGPDVTLGTLQQSQYASAGIPSTEFSLASEFRVTLNYAPSSSNKVTPLNNAFVFGVTPFPQQGNNALINTLLAAGVNLIGTGAAGGISGTLIQGGKMLDGNPFKYWYSVDYTQINLQRNMIAALIDGANNPQNPLDYDQPGVNTLQQSAVSTMSTGIGAGLVLNPIKQTTLSAAALQSAIDAGTYAANTLVNADPFASYATENPNDYQSGTYNGISVDYTPLRGFENITVNVTVSNFAG
jgi:hypothetical protein